MEIWLNTFCGGKVTAAIYIGGAFLKLHMWYNGTNVLKRIISNQKEKKR